MNPKIQKLKDDIERLEGELRDAMHSCNHIDAKLYNGKSSGSYYDDSEEYIYVDCADCGINYTYYEDDKMFPYLKSRI
jgi:hypothetical protein